MELSPSRCPNVRGNWQANANSPIGHCATRADLEPKPIADIAPCRLAKVRLCGVRRGCPVRRRSSWWRPGDGYTVMAVSAVSSLVVV